MSAEDQARLSALAALLAALKASEYEFTTPTPLTHARVIARPDKKIARDLRDVFGWSLPFRRETIDAEIVVHLEASEALEQRGGLLASKFRVSTLDQFFFLHSAFPTAQQDAVFFGPDSYRFASFLRTELPRLPPRAHIVDLGAGSGVGVVIAAQYSEAQITPVDINPAALELAQANMFFNLAWGSGGFLGDGLNAVSGAIDTVIANPPYIADPLHRAYRDGGAMHGAAISLDWARQAAERLQRGGAFLLYTGSAIVDGEDRFKAALLKVLDGFDVTYRELDPDVFGEELERADYADVERIAVVGVVAVKR